MLRPTGSARLRAQVRAGSVVGTCACGCSSLQLTTTAPPVPPADVAAMSTTGRFDYVGVGADGTNPAGQDVRLALHVVEGVIVELEIFAGEGVAAAAPAVADLRGVTLI